MELKIDVVGNWRLELGRKYEGLVLSGVGLLDCTLRIGLKGYLDYVSDIIKPNIIA